MGDLNSEVVSCPSELQGHAHTQRPLTLLMMRLNLADLGRGSGSVSSRSSFGVPRGALGVNFCWTRQTSVSTKSGL